MRTPSSRSARIIITWITIAWCVAGCGGSGSPGSEDAGLDGAADAVIAVDVGMDATPELPDAGAPDPDSFQWELPPDGVAPDVFQPPPEDHCEAIECTECVFYVGTGGSDQAAGTTPGAPFATIQTALDAAAAEASHCCDCEVRVGAGTYFVFDTSPEDTVALRERVSLLGGYPVDLVGARDPDANPTVLDARAGEGVWETVYHVVTGADHATLDGFTVTNGFAIAEEAPLADTPHYGGGMLNVGVSPTVRDCRFVNNQARYGGAVYNVDNAPTFVRCRFEDNSANVEGAGMYNLHSVVTLEDPIFLTNSASAQGGALVMAGASTGTIQGTGEGACLFDANVGWSDAGAILNSASQLAISGCDFVGNKGAYKGGAIYSQDATLEVLGCNFQENFTYVECDFPACGKQGGAVFCTGGAASLTDSTFIDNQGWSCVEFAGHQECSGLGGALGAVGEAEVSLTSCSFEGNLGGLGGAIGVRYVSLTTEGLELIGNEAVHASSQESGSSGGAIYVRDAAVTLGALVCSGNAANLGGCLHALDTDLTVHRGRFELNTSKTGGAVHLGRYQAKDAPATFEGCLFRGNTALYWGGAAYLQLHAGVNAFHGCTLYGNDAEGGWGEALYLDHTEGGVFTIANSIIWGHEDPIVHWPGAAPTIDDYTLNTQTNSANLGTSWDEPVFVDPPEDLRLAAESTCIDAGGNQFVTQGVDLDGNPRIVNETVDLGPYERQEVQ